MKKGNSLNSKTLFITRAAVIAALYVALTLMSAIFGLDSKAIQVRFSEALCVLPIYTSAAVPGVTVGCFIYNLFFGVSPLDTVFGTLATLIGATCTYYIRVFHKHPLLAGIPTVISNTLIIPFVIVFAFSDGNLALLPFTMLTVALGEIVSCMILGTVLLAALRKHRATLFGKMTNGYSGKAANNNERNPKERL